MEVKSFKTSWTMIYLEVRRKMLARDLKISSLQLLIWILHSHHHRLD